MWNDQETSLDLLGHRRIAQTLVSLMQQEALRPLTIGIHGSWGAGKSSILSLVDAQLRDDPHTLCFTFNGWLYQGYEDTKSALMETVVHELLKRRSSSQTVIDLGKSIFRRINWLKAAKTTGTLAISAALTATLGLPPTALFGLAGAAARVKQLTEPKEDSTPEITVALEDDGPWLKPEHATVPAQIQAFRDELQELIKRVEVERLVVLVDDLDRCLPGAVIDILEAIKLFLFVPGTVFIIATDEAMIEYAVRRHYPDLPVSQADYTKHYLEKLIQIPIRIPSLNQLQTQNYIRFLLLQYHLQGDNALLDEICQAFEKSRTTPYDTTALTYEFITSKLIANNTDQSLRSVLHVAEQLGSILAAELRGNPRNIKRFMNTVFLRKRVAEIYGLHDLKVGVLSKLLLLERFHDREYTQIIAEITSSTDGRSATIQRLEKPAEPEKADKPTAKKVTRVPNDAGAKEENELVAWAKLEPTLIGVDLRPYLFVSREQAISFQPLDDIPHALVAVLEVLASGSRMAMQGQLANITALTEPLARLLFRQLEKLAVKENSWQTESKPMKGLIYLVQQHPGLEPDLINLFQAIPAQELGTWVASNLDFIQSPGGSKAKLEFFDNVQRNAAAPTGLKTLITQLAAR